MFLAWREILFARTRFLLMGVVLALMSILIVLISGLTAGLVNDGVSGLKALDAEVIAFEKDTEISSAFTRSTVDVAETDALAAADGVTGAAPLGLTIVNGRNQDDVPVDLTLFGVQPGSFIAPEGLPELSPERPEGRPTDTEPGVILSGTLADSGMAVGDTITLEQLGTELTVLGFTDDQRTFGHVDIAYTPLDVWQEIQAGARPGEAAPAEAYRQASVIVAQTDGTDADELNGASGLDMVTLEESFQASPGYGPETMTLSMIEWFLYIITALVTGAFFLVWTIQRAGDIAVMRAIGATRGFLLRDSLGQAVVILLVSIAVGVGLAVGLGLWLESTPMPYSTEAGPIVGGAAMLFFAGLLGGLIAIYRVTRTNPLTALGENR